MTANGVEPVKDVKARLAELQAKQDARVREREAVAEAQELERAELVERFETEHGAIGSEFEILDFRRLGEGFVAVKRPELSLHKRFTAAVDKAREQKKPIGEADYDAYVAPAVIYPSVEEFRRICDRRYEVAGRCAMACMSMHAVRGGEDAGKF